MELGKRSGPGGHSSKKGFAQLTPSMLAPEVPPPKHLNF